MTSPVSLGTAPGTANVPSGTVTFLFTDIQGSTRLLERLREQYAQVLAEHRDLMRASFARHNGHEVETQGDSFFVVFSRALDALACVVEAQHALAAHDWPAQAVVRVRMGLHTGEALLARTGYVGIDVHRAARIAAAGHGGQVLLSQTARDLVLQDLPAGLALRSLGEHKLKDIRFPQPIWQLDIDGLPSDFPSLKTAGTEAPPTPGEAPFKGLQYFSEADAELFFGREALIGRLVEAMCEERFLAVVGASGSGKSSLVRAGLVPALRRGGRLRGQSDSLCANAAWQIFVLTPTGHPLEALATTLTRGVESLTAAASLMDDLRRDTRSLHLWVQRYLRRAERGQAAAEAERLLIVVDQFEELFTLCRDEDERRAFVESLLHAAGADRGGASVLLTLRADFYEHLSPYPDLCDAVAEHQQYIGAMNAGELRQAIEAPAAAGGWEFSPGLVDLLLHDVGASEARQPEPGALPLLSHALLETWQRRRANLMNLRAYAESGGVRGAIARTAERVYQHELTPEQQAIARSIFLRLTELGEGTQDTRRRAIYGELVAADSNPDQVRDVLARLADARLITTGEQGVEVAHEALIREWPTLRDWLNADREWLRLHRHLTEAAQGWARLGRDPGELYRGARLAQTAEWAASHAVELNALEHEFLVASQAAADQSEAEREAIRQRELAAAQQLAEEQARSAQRLRLRNRLLTAAGAGALLLAALAAVFAFQSNSNFTLARNAQAAAEADRNSAISRELAVQSELNITIDPDRSILLALAALEKAETVEALNALHKAVQSSRLRLSLSGHEAEVYGVAYSPDGTLIASASDDTTARIWDAATGKPLHVLRGHSAGLNDVSFSSDGRYLATAGGDGLVKLWDVATGAEVRSLSVHTSPVWSVSFSPDGTALATAATNDTAVKVWNVATGELLYMLSSPDWSSLTPSGEFELADAIFSPDGRTIALGIYGGIDSQDGRVEIWDVATRSLAVTLDANFNVQAWPSFAFSPDSSRLVTALSEDLKFAVWDVSTGRKLLVLAEGGNSAIFSPDGKWILTGSSGSRAQIWDAESGDLRLTLVGQGGLVVRVAAAAGCALAPEPALELCGRLATAGTDGTVKVWDLSPGGQAEVLTAPGGFIGPLADDRLLTLYQPEGGTILLDAELPAWTSAAGQPPPTPAVSVYALPDGGARLATRGFAPPMGEPWLDLPNQAGWVLSVQSDGSVEILDGSRQGQVLHAFCCLSPNAATRIDIRADLNRLAYGNADGTVEVWDIAAGVRLRSWQVNASEPLERVLLVPDGRRLVTIAGGAEIWDVDTQESLLQFSDRPYTTAEFAPDGQTLLLATCEGEVEVRALQSGELLATLAGHTGCVTDMAFSPDGKLLAVGHFGPITLWDWQTRTVVGQIGLRSAMLSFSPDGSRLVTVTIRPQAFYTDRTTYVYLTRPADLIALARSRVTRALTVAECRQYLHQDTCN